MHTFASRHTPTHATPLPFVLRPATTRDDFIKVAAIRHEAYARHVPEFAASLREPEPADFAVGTLVLLAESKADGTPVGTLRLHLGLPLPLETSVTLPPWLQCATRAEATRLGVKASPEGHLARNALFKACYLNCLQAGVEWMVVTARSPIDKVYAKLLFDDVFEQGLMLPMRHVGDLPHRVMALSITRAKQTWTERSHPLLGFMLHENHPEIRLAPLM